MMEYTMARVAMVMCGAILLAAVIPSVTSVYDECETAVMQDQSETLCRMLDSFHDSEAEEMTICLQTVLPQNSSVMMEGYFVTIIDGDSQFRYNTEYTLESDKDLYKNNDYVRVTKDGDSLIIESLD